MANLSNLSKTTNCSSSKSVTAVNIR
jgi:hypothetical protein